MDGRPVRDAPLDNGVAVLVGLVGSPSFAFARVGDHPAHHDRNPKHGPQTVRLLARRERPQPWQTTGSTRRRRSEAGCRGSADSGAEGLAGGRGGTGCIGHHNGDRSLRLLAW